MNRTFKVAKSLTRGVVVTSEKASSYQGKAVKTVIAAAVASLVAGAAMAAETTDAAKSVVFDGTDVTISSGDVALTQAETLKQNGTVTITGGKVTIDNLHVTGNGTDDEKSPVLNITGGEVTVVAGKGNDFQNFSVTGGTLNVNGGETAESAWRNNTHIGGYSYPVMDGATELRQTLVAGSKTVVNVTNATLWSGFEDKDATGKLLITDGATVNLAGKKLDQSGVLYVGTNGTLEVADGATVTVAKDQYGALIAPKLVVDGGSIANAGYLNVFQSTGGENKDEKVSASLNSADAANLQVTLKNGGSFTTTSTGETLFKGSVDVDGGSLANAGATTVAGTLTVADGSVQNTGVLTANKVVINKGGVVTTAISIPAKTETTKEAAAPTTSYAVLDTTLNEGGALNITELNAGEGTGLVFWGAKVNNTEKAANLVLNGGEVQYNGKTYEGNLKLGNKEHTATLKVKSGDYNLAKLEFGSASGSSATIEENGSLTIGELVLNPTLLKTENSAFLNNSGSLTIGTVDLSEVKAADAQDGAIVNTGKIYTAVGNVLDLTKDKDGTITAAAQNAFGKVISGDTGSVFDSSVSTLTLDEYNTVATAMGNLTLLKAQVTDKDGANIKFDDVDDKGLNAPSTTLDGTLSADKKSVILNNSKDIVVANVNADAATVNVSGSATLQLAGNNGVLFGESVETVSVTNAKGLTLGHEEFADNTGTITGVLNLDQGGLNVVAGDFTVGGIEGSQAVAVSNSALTTAYLATTGTSTITDGTLAVLGNKPAKATKAAAEGDTATETAKPFANAISVSKVEFASSGKFGILSVGAKADAAEQAVLDAYGEAADSTKVVYVTKQAVFTEAAAPDANYLVDLKQVAATEGFAAKDGVLNNTLTLTGTNAIKLVNLDAAALTGDAGKKTLQLAKANASATDFASVDFGNWFYSTDVNMYDGIGVTSYSSKDGSIVFKVNPDVAVRVEEDLYLGKAAVDAANNVVWGQNEIVDAIGFGSVAYADAVKATATYKALVAKDSMLAAQYLEAQMSRYFEQLDEASVMAVAGGAFGTALDINDQVTAALSRRVSVLNNVQRGEVGVTPWVDVFGTKNEAKRIYGFGAGYEADVYGAVLGFDYTASCGGVLGLAFNVGQADGNSTGLDTQVDNDVDFYGVSLYAAKQFGDFNVKADFGYTRTKNDLSMTGVTKTWKESQDADLLTFGVGTEFLAKAGAVNVVPHAGIRLTRIDMDDSKYGADYDTMTVYQLPLGVAFSGTFDTNGWKIAPVVDLSVVPTFGDKDAEVSFAGGVTDSIRVIDSNPIQATLGVNAQNGAWTFGLNYGLTAGSDDRMNNAFNANLRYSF